MDLSSYVLMQSDYFDTRFGPIDIFYKPDDATDIIFCKNKVSFSAQEHQHSIRMAKDRLQRNFPFIMPMIHLEVDDEKWLIRVFFEYPNEDLFARKEALTEVSEMIHFFHDSLNAIGYLQKNSMIHGNLRPEFIYFNPKTNRYILLDRLVDVSSPNQTQIGNIEQGLTLYMAPVIFNEVVQGNQMFRHNPYKCETFSLAMVFLSVAFCEEEVQLLYDVENKRFDVNRFNWLLQNVRQQYFSEGDRSLLGEFIFDILLNLDSKQSMAPLKALRLLKATFLVTPETANQNNVQNTQQLSSNLNSSQQSERNSNQQTNECPPGFERHNSMEIGLYGSMKDAAGLRFMSFCNFPGNSQALEAFHAEMQKLESEGQRRESQTKLGNEFQYVSEKIPDGVDLQSLQTNTQSVQQNVHQSDHSSQQNPGSDRNNISSDSDTGNVFNKPLVSEKNMNYGESQRQTVQSVSKNFFGLEENPNSFVEFRDSMSQKSDSQRISERGSNFFKIDASSKEEYEQQYQNYLMKYAKAPDDNNYSLFNLGSSRKFITDDGMWMQVDNPDLLMPLPDAPATEMYNHSVGTPIIGSKRFSFQTSHLTVPLTELRQDSFRKKSPSNEKNIEPDFKIEEKEDQEDYETEEQSFRESFRSQKQESGIPNAERNSSKVENLPADSLTDLSQYQSGRHVTLKADLPQKELNSQTQLANGLTDSGIKATQNAPGFSQKTSPRSSVLSNANDEDYRKLTKYLESGHDDSIDFLQSQRNVNKNFSFQYPPGSDILQHLGDEKSQREGIGFKKSQFQNYIEIDYGSNQSGGPSPRNGDSISQISGTPKSNLIDQTSDSGNKFKRQTSPRVYEEITPSNPEVVEEGLPTREERKTLKTKLNYTSEKKVSDVTDFGHSENKHIEHDSVKDEAAPITTSVTPHRNVESGMQPRNSEQSLRQVSANKISNDPVSFPLTTGPISNQTGLKPAALPDTNHSTLNDSQASLSRRESERSRTDHKAYHHDSHYYSHEREHEKHDQGVSATPMLYKPLPVSKRSIQIQTSEREIVKLSMVSDKLIQTDDDWQSLTENNSSLQVSTSRQSGYKTTDKPDTKPFNNRLSERNTPHYDEAPRYSAKNIHQDIHPKVQESIGIGTHDDHFIVRHPAKVEAVPTPIPEPPKPSFANEFLAIFANAEPIEIINDPVEPKKRIIVNKGDFEKKENSKKMVEVIVEDEEAENVDDSMMPSQRNISSKSIAKPNESESMRNIQPQQVNFSRKQSESLQTTDRPSEKRVEILRERGSRTDDLATINSSKRISQANETEVPISFPNNSQPLTSRQSHSNSVSSHSHKPEERQSNSSKEPIKIQPNKDAEISTVKTIAPQQEKLESKSEPPKKQEPSSIQETKVEVVNDSDQIIQNGTLLFPTNKADESQSKDNTKDAKIKPVAAPVVRIEHERVNTTPDLKPRRDFSPVFVNHDFRDSSPRPAPKVSADQIIVPEKPRVIVRSTTPNAPPPSNEHKLLKAKLLSNESNEDPTTKEQLFKNLPIRSLQWVNTIQSVSHGSTTQSQRSNQLPISKIDSSQVIQTKTSSDFALPIKPTNQTFSRPFNVQSTPGSNKVLSLNPQPNFKPAPIQKIPMNQPPPQMHQQTVRGTIIRTSVSPVRIVQHHTNLSEKQIPQHSSVHKMQVQVNSMQTVYNSPLSSNNSSRQNSLRSPVPQRVQAMPIQQNHSNGIPLDMFRKVEVHHHIDADNYDIISQEREFSLQDSSKKSFPTSFQNFSARDSEKKDAPQFISEKDLVFVRKENGKEIYRFKNQK